jgi:hypothetical protein
MVIEDDKYNTIQRRHRPLTTAVSAIIMSSFLAAMDFQWRQSTRDLQTGIFAMSPPGRTMHSAFVVAG